MLRSWLQRPLTSPSKIAFRHTSSRSCDAGKAQARTGVSAWANWACVLAPKMHAMPTSWPGPRTAVVASQPNFIVVNASFPARTLAELLQMARTQKLAFASPSSGR